MKHVRDIIIKGPKTITSIDAFDMEECVSLDGAVFYDLNTNDRRRPFE